MIRPICLKRFVDKWMNQCAGIESIDCDIDADEVEWTLRSIFRTNFCSYLCLLCHPRDPISNICLSIFYHSSKAMYSFQMCP